MTILSFMNHTIFDNGACSKLAKTLKQCRIERPLLCTDIGLVKIGLVDEIKGFLDNHTEVTLFDGTPENPTQIAVDMQLSYIKKWIVMGSLL